MDASNILSLILGFLSSMFICSLVSVIRSEEEPVYLRMSFATISFILLLITFAYYIKSIL